MVSIKEEEKKITLQSFKEYSNFFKVHNIKQIYSQNDKNIRGEQMQYYVLY